MRILITGGTNGMGKGVAKALASASEDNHEIIILCRSEKLCLSTIRELEGINGNHKVSMVLCDLTRLDDVRNAIDQIQNAYDYLDGLFINAGIGYAANRVMTEDNMVAHFQVNYLSQFMLTLNLLELLERSKSGGRVIFNATRGGEIHWNDLQMEKDWSYEDGIHQAMVAKRMFLNKLHKLYSSKDVDLSFIGFEISKTVWTNQLQIIPIYMKVMATVMKFLGRFISIDACGKIISPLLTEDKVINHQRSGKFITWSKKMFKELEEEASVLDPNNQDRLWAMSLDLCSDEKTKEISEDLHVS